MYGPVREECRVRIGNRKCSTADATFELRIEENVIAPSCLRNIDSVLINSYPFLQARLSIKFDSR